MLQLSKILRPWLGSRSRQPGLLEPLAGVSMGSCLSLIGADDVFRDPHSLEHIVRPSPPGLIKSLSQWAWPGVPALAEVGGIASSLCLNPPLLQPIST